VEGEALVDLSVAVETFADQQDMLDALLQHSLRLTLAPAPVWEGVDGHRQPEPVVKPGTAATYVYVEIIVRPNSIDECAHE